MNGNQENKNLCVWERERANILFLNHLNKHKITWQNIKIRQHFFQEDSSPINNWKYLQSTQFHNPQLQVEIQNILLDSMFIASSISECACSTSVFIWEKTVSCFEIERGVLFCAMMALTLSSCNFCFMRFVCSKYRLLKQWTTKYNNYIAI